MKKSKKEPKVVEFMGLPEAGKTEHIDQLKRRLKGLGISVRFIQDQIRDAPLKGDEVEKNKWAIRKVGNLIAEAKEQDWNLILVERGGWAIYASLKALLKQLKRKRQIRKARRGLGLAIDIVQEEDFFVLIEIPPKIALERDQQLGATQTGSIITPTFLEPLEEVYQWIKEEKLPRGRTRIIDGQDDFQENQEKILKSLLRLLEAKAENSNSLASLKARERKETQYG